MWKRLRKPLLWLLAIQVATWVAGQIIARRLTEGDEDSDDFRIAAVNGGRRFVSRAGRLRSGAVMVWMGGVELDLRQARLDPAGATLDISATFGGVQVAVPQNWAVEVDKRVFAGGVDSKLPESPPAGAPRLHVSAKARMGGVLVTTDPVG